MANTHARCGAASHIAPRHFILPHNRKKRANAKFNTKNTHEIPATVAAAAAHHTHAVTNSTYLG